LKQCSVLIRIPVNSLRSKLVKFFFIYANLMNYINWFTCDVTLVTNYVFKDRFIPLSTASIRFYSFVSMLWNADMW
jgi:hypothetical protein